MLVLEPVRIDRVRVVDRVEVVDRVAVALRRGMAVVQMGRHLGDAVILRDLHRRQFVLEAHQDRLAVFRLDQRPGNMFVEREEPGLRVVGMHLDVRLLHFQFVELLRREVVGGVRRAGTVGAVGRAVGRRRVREVLVRDPLGRAIDRRGAVGRAILHVLRLHRRLHHQARHRLHPRTDRRACRHPAQGRIRIGQGRSGLTEGAGAETRLGDQRAARGQQAQTHHLAPVQLGLHDLLSIALCSQRQLFFPVSHWEHSIQGFRCVT